MGLTPPVVIIVTAIIYSYNSAWNVGDVYTSSSINRCGAPGTRPVQFMLDISFRGTHREELEGPIAGPPSRWPRCMATEACLRSLANGPYRELHPALAVLNKRPQGIVSPPGKTTRWQAPPSWSYVMLPYSVVLPKKEMFQTRCSDLSELEVGGNSFTT